MGNKLDMSKRWGPCAPCTGEVRSTPQWKLPQFSACEFQPRNHSKFKKMQLFQKLFRTHFRARKSLRNTLRALRTSQEHVLKLSGTFHFRQFFDQKCRHPELQGKMDNIKTSNFEAFPPPICSIFHEEFESSDAEWCDPLNTPQNAQKPCFLYKFGTTHLFSNFDPQEGCFAPFPLLRYYS